MAISELRTRAAALVHASVRGDERRASAHERFILSRLLVGGGALALTPAFLAWRGTPGLFDIALIAAAGLQLMAVVLLSRSARLDLAHPLSSAGIGLTLAAVVAATGGMASPWLVALAVLPIEAAGFAVRGLVLRAGLVAALTAVLVALGQRTGTLPVAELDPAAMPWLALAALLLTLGALAAMLRQRETMLVGTGDTGTRMLLDHLGELVTWHDASGAVVFANAAARSLAGAEPHALLGRGLFERVHIADRPLFLKALSDAAHGEGQATACFRTLFVPSAEAGASHHPVAVWLEMRACRVDRSLVHEGAAVICVMRDVTARRVGEEERDRGHAEAVKANDIKSRFLATVSHELRTPLNAIIGFSEMLSGEEARRLDPAKRAEYAGIIHSSGHHLLEVVNTLLDISKIESGAMAIEPEPVDLAAMARECAALMALKAERGDVQVETVIGGAIPGVEADRRAMKQVVLNLLSNAIKFTPPGGRVVLALVRDGDWVDLSVSDTGIGIAPGDLPRLGDPFFQCKNAYDRSHEGTGLGLSVVRGLVGLHGGQLTVESALGAGTRVGVRLPLAQPPAQAEPARIVTFARAPRRSLDTKEPLRLTA